MIVLFGMSYQKHTNRYWCQKYKVDSKVFALKRYG